MTLEDLTKNNLVTLIGLAVLSAALPKLLPQMRPAARSAIKFGLDLFTESEGEAEAELIHSLVSATLKQIGHELREPAGHGERRERVRRRVRHFTHQARKHSRRWAGEGEAGQRSYHRYVASLEAGLAQQQQHADPAVKPVIDEAFAALSQA